MDDTKLTVLQALVEAADNNPFMSIGHFVEHVAPVREALSALSPQADRQEAVVKPSGNGGWKVSIGQEMIALWAMPEAHLSMKDSADNFAARVNVELRGGVRAFGCRKESTGNLCLKWCGGKTCPMTPVLITEQPAEGEGADEIKKILQDACDRDWSDETLRQTATIAANGLYWRQREIENLRREVMGPDAPPVGQPEADVCPRRQTCTPDDCKYPWCRYPDAIPAPEGQNAAKDEGRDDYRELLRDAKRIIRELMNGVEWAGAELICRRIDAHLSLWQAGSDAE